MGHIICILIFTINLFGIEILDSVTKKPIDAILVCNEMVEKIDKLISCTGTLIAKSVGYRRLKIDGENITKIELEPIFVRGVYLSIDGLLHKGIRDDILGLIDKGEINSLVLDVKDDKGRLLFDIKGLKGIKRDAKELLEKLRSKKIYLIARVAVFKDDFFSSNFPEFAIKTENGNIWKDEQGVSWSNPFSKEVRQYNQMIAKEASKIGFDEIQFDYVRFPDKANLISATQEERVSQIVEFLKESKEILREENVFISADLFGYTVWQNTDIGIGQLLESISPLLDYTSHMLYPSGFLWGIPKYKKSVEYPFEIVYLSLQKAKSRTNLESKHFRPWIQGFRDYAFDKRNFGKKELELQIKAIEDFNGSGYLIWNPKNRYNSIF